jgi:hypothetical protein
MRKGGGKSKGSAFERTMCKELSLWVSDGQHKDVFWRSAMSGGRSTVAMAKGDKLSAQVGDISSVHRLGHVFIDKFMVECKAYKTLNYESLIKGKGTLLGFWERAVKDAEEHDKLPMLIGKQNNYPIVVCLNRAGVKLLKTKKLKLRVYGADLYLMLFDDYLKINPKVLRRSRL